MRLPVVALLLIVATTAHGSDQTLIRYTLDPAPAQGALRFEPLGGGDAVIALIVDGAADVTLARGSRWYVTSAIPGWWMPREILVVEDVQTLTRTLRPTGRIAGTTTDGRLSVRIDSGEAKGTTVDCDVAEKAWRCELPIGTFDLAFRAPGTAPAYRWNVRVDRNAERNLGALELRPGASVAGWVTIDSDRKAKPKGATVRLARLVSGGVAPMRERLERPVAEAAVAPNGFFQLAGLAAGTYRLIVEQPGFARTTFHPVEVYEASETAIKAPLTLRRPIPLRFAVEPTRDWLERPWRLKVRRLDDFTRVPGEPVFDAAVDASGMATVNEQSPGMYDVIVADAAGNQLVHRVLDVGEGELPRIEVSVVNVTGTVKRGDTPVAASLWFGGRFGVVSVATTSDDEGRFHAVLPRAGAWRVTVETPTNVSDVQTTVTAGDELTIRLPDNLVEGIVVDENEQPMASCIVRLEQEHGALDVKTDAAGTFAFRAVPEGRARLTAACAKRVTDETVFVAHERGAFGPFRLKLERSRRVRGKVVALNGPVAGALVRVAATPGATPPFNVTATTDVDGSFAVDVPDAHAAALAIVSPPGNALRVYDIPLDGRVVVLNARADGGTLTLRVPPPKPGMSLTILQNGKPLPLNDIGRWARSHGVLLSDDGGVHALPNLSAGAYRVCLNDDCRDGALTPGGTLELDLR